MGQLIDIKVYEDVVIHHFTVTYKGVGYEVMKPRGELVARSAAEVLSIHDDADGKIIQLSIRTQGHVFEVLPSQGDYSGHTRWRAYKC